MALRDLLAVPQAAVLGRQGHQGAAGAGACRPAGIDQHHERQQADHLGLVGHERGQDPAEPDRLGAQVSAGQLVARGGGVALVEHQVDHREHGSEPVRELGAPGDPVGDPRIADLGLGSHDALRHGGLGHDEGAGDLGRREAPKEAKGQRDLRGARQRWVATGEDQTQAIVLHGKLLVGLVTSEEQHRLRLSVLPGCLTAQPVHDSVARRS